MRGPSRRSVDSASTPVATRSRDDFPIFRIVCERSPGTRRMERIAPAAHGRRGTCERALGFAHSVRARARRAPRGRPRARSGDVS